MTGRAQDAPPALHEHIATGDLGYVDADGFLVVEGRRRNVLITSFGRNVAPEWPEAALCAERAIAQAVVFGEARPRLVAVVVPSRPDAADDEIGQAIASANARLPDYARVAGWVRADVPFTAAEGLATANGRPRRDSIARRWATPIDALYASPAFQDQPTPTG